MSGYAARDGQVTMLNGASQVFRHGGIALVEAGTGTGKSFGYGLSGAVIGKELGKKLIISTANVSLQSQLINKDLPIINKVVGEAIKTGVAKGKSRFICWAKVEKNNNNADCSALMNLKNDGVNLDFDSIPENINAKNISHVRVTNQCKGRQCAYYDECEYQTNRDAVKSANIIITNHSYLLTDLSLGGGIILPKLSDCLVAIDECHNLPKIAIDAFSEKHLLERSILELNKVGLFDANGKYKNEVGLINKAIVSLNNELNDMHNLLESSDNLRKIGLVVYKDGVIPQGLADRKGKISDISKVLNDRMEFLSQYLDDEMSEDENPLIDTLHSNIFRGMIENKKIQKVWDLFGELNTGESPIAKWFRNDDKNNDIEVGASITCASKKLKETLIESGASIVLTSATMSENKNFNHFKKECGITNKCIELTCKSPFEYKDSASITVPSMKFEPSNVEGHTQELIENLNKTLKEGEGALVLFASKDQMLKVRDGVIKTINAKILIQGEISKKELIVQHCKNVDDGITSVIFGLDSFYEGIDLHGKYLSTVVISKLPFPAMNDPVFIVKKHYIEQNGGNSFSEMILPYVTKKLIQGVGRLIRTMQDYGDIYIFDTRIATKGYGIKMLNQLPDMKRNILVEI